MKNAWAIETAFDATRCSARLLGQDADWIAPVLWRSEFRNVFAGYLRRALLDLAGARAVMDSAVDLTVPLVTTDKKLVKSFPDIAIHIDHFDA